MLVLSRKEQQRIVISPPGQEPIIVTLVEIRGDKVRLGFDADPGVVIDREEITILKR